MLVAKRTLVTHVLLVQSVEPSGKSAGGSWSGCQEVPPSTVCATSAHVPAAHGCAASAHPSLALTQVRSSRAALASFVGGTVVVTDGGVVDETLVTVVCVDPVVDVDDGD